VKAVALDRVALDAPARDTLRDLKVETVGDLLRLPLHDLEARFGAGMEPLHRGARGEAALPVQPAEAPESAARRLFLDAPTADGGRLFRLAERMLPPLLAELASRRRAAATLVLSLRLDRGGEVEERIRPAGATLDSRRLSSLLRLRLSSLRLRSPVTEIGLDAEEAPLAPEQGSLLEEPPTRDLAAAAEALARIRAEFGEESVARARLLDAHLPEARFDWAPLGEMPPPNARAVAERPLVRRILAKAEPLMHRPSETVAGPFELSGGWWRAEARREYRYLRDRDGRWLWAFFDAGRRRWFLQGRVE
jgi:protein ImuB